MRYRSYLALPLCRAFIDNKRCITLFEVDFLSLGYIEPEGIISYNFLWYATGIVTDERLGRRTDMFPLQLRPRIVDFFMRSEFQFVLPALCDLIISDNSTDNACLSHLNLDRILAYTTSADMAVDTCILHLRGLG